MKTTPKARLLVTLTTLATAVLVCAGVFVAGWNERAGHLPAPLFCDDVTCAQIATRMADIGDQIAANAARPRYLAIGDSLTESARLPVLCGRVGINAGISGATTATFRKRARGLAASARPDFVVVGLGTNDALRFQSEGFRERLSGIVASLAGYRLILAPLPQGPRIPDFAAFNAIVSSFDTIRAEPVPVGHTAADGVHFGPSGNALWTRSLADAAARLLGETTCLGP